MHARIAGLVSCALAVAVSHAAESQRWQVVSANQAKVGHAEVLRTVDASGVLDSTRIEIRLGTAGRRVRWRLHFETESAPAPV